MINQHTCGNYFWNYLSIIYFFRNRWTVNSSDSTVCHPPRMIFLNILCILSNKQNYFYILHFIYNNEYVSMVLSPGFQPYDSKGKESKREKCIKEWQVTDLLGSLLRIKQGIVVL